MGRKKTARLVDMGVYSLVEYNNVAVRLNNARLWRKGIDERTMAEAIPDVKQYGRDQDIAIDCLRGVIALIPKFRNDCNDCGRFKEKDIRAWCDKTCPHYMFHMKFDPYFITKHKPKTKGNK